MFKVRIFLFVVFKNLNYDLVLGSSSSTVESVSGPIIPNNSIVQSSTRKPTTLDIPSSSFVLNNSSTKTESNNNIIDSIVPITDPNVENLDNSISFSSSSDSPLQSIANDQTNGHKNALPSFDVNNNMPFTLAPLMPLNSPDSDFSLDQSPIPNVFFQPNSDNSLQSVYMDSVDDLCPSALIRGLFWNSIRKNEVTSQKCPGGTLGVVKWSCMFNPELGVAEWYPPRPDFTECRSIWLENLAGQLNNREPVIKIASELALMTSSKLLYSEDLIKIASIINKFLENAVTSIQNVQTIEVWHRHQVLKELLMFIVEIISNLLGNIQDDAWLDLSIINRKEIASSFIRSLEKSALLLAENTNHDGSTAIAKPNVCKLMHLNVLLLFSYFFNFL